MKRGIIIILCMVLVISLLTGCIKRDVEPKEGDVRLASTGTKGLSMQFANNLPPSKMYDSGDLNFVLELTNKGTYDLTGDKCMLYLHGFDKSIIRALDNEKQCGVLDKKSIYNPNGGFTTQGFETDSQDIVIPEYMAKYDPSFVVTACYKYQTRANPVVCINPNLYKLGAIEEACVVKDVLSPEGQGAPIVVSKVGVEMIGEDKVSFEVTVENKGSGTALNRRTSLTGRGESSCPFNLKEYNDYNIVDYSIEMTEGSIVECNPQIQGDYRVRLINNKAIIYCTFNINAESAYTTPLLITLDYNYMDSISKNIEIIRTPK